MPATCIAAAAEVEHGDVIDVLVQDRDWVDAEFAAVLTASGIRDPLLVGVALRPPLREEPAPDGLPATRPARSESGVAVHPEARTRSPPDGRPVRWPGPLLEGSGPPPFPVLSIPS